MRIVAGIAKGTRLKMVPGNHVRPTSDRVKESLFSILGPFFAGGWVLDLFAGTGSLGLEALSRGMEHAILVDQSRTSCKTIRDNVKLCRMSDQVEVYCQNARVALQRLAQRELKFDLVFLDPPYDQPLLIPTITYISKRDLLADGGIIVAEHQSRRELPEVIETLTAYRRLTYGETAITLYRQQKEDERDEGSSISG